MKKIILILVVIVILLVGGIFFFKNTFSNADFPNNNVNSETGLINRDSNAEVGMPKTYRISISDFSYNPTSLIIKKGDIVIWTNMDDVKHTVTSDSGNELSSELFGNGESYSHTFENSGTFNYHCIPHPQMKGSIIK
jgi:plastocyanin